MDSRHTAQELALATVRYMEASQVSTSREIGMNLTSKLIMYKIKDESWLTKEGIDIKSDRNFLWSQTWREFLCSLLKVPSDAAHGARTKAFIQTPPPLVPQRIPTADNAPKPQASRSDANETLLISLHHIEMAFEDICKCIQGS